MSFVACQQHDIANNSSKTKYSDKALSSPVYLQKDTTKIVLADYIIDVAQIDSIQTNEHYQINYKKGQNDLLIISNRQFNPIENLRIFIQGEIYNIPLFKNTKKKVRFVFSKSKKVKKVQFKSQIVGWQTVEMKQNDREWYYETNLVPGNYQYLFVVDGKEVLDKKVPQISNGMGGFNSLLAIESSQDKAPFLETREGAEKQFSLQSDNEIENALVYIDNKLLPTENTVVNKHEINVKLPKTSKERSYVRVYAYNQFGKSNDVLIPLHNGKIITDAKQLKRTDFHTQIMYFLMVDRFFDGEKSNNRPIKSDSVLDKVNFKGGDLQGVVKKINEGYFKNLGVNTIWLSPILQNPEKAYGKWIDPPTKFSGYHGYWPVSNIKIDDRFGDKKSLNNLIDGAHQQNMNVILDYVANHVHKDHILYKTHPKWVTDLYLPDGTMNTEKWDSHRLTTWFDTFLPTIDFSKHEVVEQMTDSAMYWLKQFDIDGFRHDATKHIQLDYWRTLTKKIRSEVKRPIYQIGETYGSPELIRSYVNTGMLNGQFNFNLYDASVAVFAKKEEPVKRLADALQETLMYYGSHNLMGNISGNQDRVRFISYASGDVPFQGNGKQIGWSKKIILSDSTAYKKLEMLQVFNLTIPGIPCIYYGDEYGMVGANDPDNRRMMQFDHLNNHQTKLLNAVKKYIKMRRNSMALQYGSTKIEEKNNVLIINRKYFDEEVIIIFNKSEKDYQYQNKNVKAGDYLIIK